MTNLGIIRGTVLCLLMIASLAGCGTTAGTVAVVTASSVGAATAANTLATNSRLEVKVEAFDATKLSSRDARDFVQPLIALHLQGRKDVAINPTESGIREIITALHPGMAELVSANAALKNNIASLKRFRKPDNDDLEEGPKLANALLDQTIAELGLLARSNDKAIQHWQHLTQSLDVAVTDGISQKELNHMANLIVAIRQHLLSQDELSITSGGLLGWLKFRLRAAAIKTRVQAGIVAPNLDSFTYTHDDLTQTNTQRIATVVRDFITLTFPGIPANKRHTPNVLKPLRNELNNIGIACTTDDIATMIQPDGSASQISWIEQILGKVSLREQVKTIRSQIVQVSYNSFGVDFNLGNIRHELLQVMLTPNAIRHVLDPANESHWQTFSWAKSYGSAGNHDVIVYLENLGLPIVKSSAFDPTKFQVAHGLMFRKAFSALVDVAGLPVQQTDLADQSPTPVDSVNLNAMRQAQLQAKSSTRQTQAKMLQALSKVIIVAEQLPSDAPDDAANLQQEVVQALTAAAKTLAGE